jgi:hypothetical protein
MDSVVASEAIDPGSTPGTRTIEIPAGGEVFRYRINPTSSGRISSGFVEKSSAMNPPEPLAE